MVFWNFYLQYGPRHIKLLASHFVQAGEFCFHQMAQISLSGDRSIIAQAVGEYEDDFAHATIYLVIPERSGFQNQDRFTRAGDLVFVADLGQLEEWVVKCIHIKTVATDQHLDADN
jgi:hypothetical protein